jgi:hypothetical protein
MAAVFFDRGKSPVELGLLRRTEWQVVLFEAVPELSNEREALSRGKANYFVTREYSHLLKVRETGARGNVDAKDGVQLHRRGRLLPLALRQLQLRVIQVCIGHRAQQNTDREQPSLRHCLASWRKHRMLLFYGMTMLMSGL